MLIYNAKIYTMSDMGVIDNGFVMTDNGKISRVGKMTELDTPPTREDFNAFGMNVYPGFIDVHTHLGMWED